MIRSIIFNVCFVAVQLLHFGVVVDSFQIGLVQPRSSRTTSFYKVQPSTLLFSETSLFMGMAQVSSFFLFFARHRIRYFPSLFFQI